MDDVERSVLYFAHQQLHLMLNRLGLTASDEAAASFIVLNEKFIDGNGFFGSVTVAQRRDSACERKEDAT